MKSLAKQRARMHYNSGGAVDPQEMNRYKNMTGMDDVKMASEGSLASQAQEELVRSNARAARVAPEPQVAPAVAAPAPKPKTILDNISDRTKALREAAGYNKGGVVKKGMRGAC